MAKHVFLHKRVYQNDRDLVVDKMIVITLFGRVVWKQREAIVMPYGHICNNCCRTGAQGRYAVKRTCLDCPL